MSNKVNSVATSSGDYVKLDNVTLTVYSQEILFAAAPLLRFEQAAVKKEELMTSPGGTITFLKYGAMIGSSGIGEQTEVETETLSTSTVLIGVTEHIRAVKVTERLLRFSMTSVLDDAASVLGHNYAQNRDAVIRDAMFGIKSEGLESSASVTVGVTNSILPVTAAGVELTRATIDSSSSPDSFLTMEMIRRGVEELATNKAPKFGGDHYLCFLHPHQASRLRGRSDWVSVVQYGDPNRVYKGEIGRIEDVRFIETTMCPVIAAGDLDTGGTTAFAVKQDGNWYFKRGGSTAPTAGSYSEVFTVSTGHATKDIYVGFLVGDNCIGLADALPVEMRDDGVKNFGRFHSLAYYALFGAGLVEAGFGATIETN